MTTTQLSLKTGRSFCNDPPPSVENRFCLVHNSSILISSLRQVCSIGRVQVTHLLTGKGVLLPSWVGRAHNVGNVSNTGSHKYEKCPQNFTQLCPAVHFTLCDYELWGKLAPFPAILIKSVVEILFSLMVTGETGVWPNSDQWGRKRHLSRDFWERFLRY